jgi:protein tyrosine/serine phosphatase
MKTKLLSVRVVQYALLFIISIWYPLMSTSLLTIPKKIAHELARFNKKNQALVLNTLYNFYPVEKNVFYRSQQLPPDVLDYYLKTYKIKTLINLRGDDNQALWWQDEQDVAKKNNTHYITIMMSAVYLTRKEDLLTLLDIFDHAPRPMLVHCVGGADRTGEVSALWVLDQQKKSTADALEQLSIKYGHRKYKNSAKDFLIKMWGGREWLLTQYDPKNYPQYCNPK